MVEGLLSLVGPASTDNPKGVVVACCPHNKNEAARNRPNGDETIFKSGVYLVEEFKVVMARSEERRSLLEGDAVLSPV
jgi:hypothetical protein